MSNSLPDNTAIVFDIRRFIVSGVTWYLPGAFIVKKDKDGQPTYIVQNATPDTIGSYGHELTPALKQLFNIIDSLTEKALEEKFNPPKGKPKPLEVLLQDEVLKRHIEQYVHRQVDVFLKKMTEKRLPLTFMGEKKALMQDLLVRYPDGGITPHLIFRRTKDGVLYRLNFTTGEERWLVRWKQPTPLTNQPGWLMVDNTLYPLPDLNGYMVKPFMTKDEQPVPNRVMRTYFQKFIMKAVERTEIEADGFDLTGTRKLEGCELSLAKHLFKNSWFVSVKFHYMGASFLQNDPREMRTALHFENESDIRIMQVKRNPEGEREYLDKLAGLGFEMKEGSLWGIPFTNDDLRFTIGGAQLGGEEPFFLAVEKLSALRPALEGAGFTLDAPVFDDKKISLLSPSWEQEIVQVNDWFDLRITIRVGQFEFPFSKLISYIRDGERFFPLPDSTFFLIPEEWMARFHGLAHLGKMDGDSLLLSKSQRPLLESLGLGDMAEPVDKKEVDFQLSPMLKAELRPYQETGARWLAQHYHEGLGACLADDMGLGKTLQTLAILLFARENRQSSIENPKLPQPSLFDEPSFNPLQALILLPASLVFNWEREIKKFAPGITVCRHVGPGRTKDGRILARYDIVLTTYQTAQRDLDFLKKTDWEYVVLDESQYIKNPQSGIFKAVGELPAKHKISLSGTPIENSLSDLWAQMQFLNPGMLGNFTYFKKHFIKPIEKQEDEVKKGELRRLVEPYLLRRTKEEVAPDLPPLTESVFYAEMTEAQAKLYEKEKSAVRNKLLNIGDPSQPQNRVAVLAALTRLRQIANHPALVEIGKLGNWEIGDEQANGTQFQSSSSGKFDDVIEYWETIRRSGHKVLIFSSFEKYLRLFRAHFEEAGQPYAWLTGDVSQAQRKKAVDQFSNDPGIQAFFMTTKAGGVGLNLTAADYVFVLDPWWNPFVESQAIARAHRIGQTEKVVAVKFISKDTIEEKILKMQERKSALAGDFLASPETVACTRAGLAELLD
ncbi:MAG: DEAD/DEAH box helicase [Lewinellaceae bacterium]|nr:DEAD/DEAH box helicase [Saprospiraceae bacterium]MCB9341813.1 DEAD/DEAH box helicase [Lewinellaceae bacterium]